MSAIGLSIINLVFILGNTALKIYYLAQKRDEKRLNLNVENATIQINNTSH